MTSLKLNSTLQRIFFNIDDPADIDFTPNEFGKGPFDRYEENMDRQPENVNNGLKAE